MAENIRIWIDADSCPAMVRDYVIKYSQKLNLPVTLCANRLLKAKPDQVFQMIVCDKEKDAADNYILEHSAPFDLVITRDIPFAARLVEKKITCINDRGTVFTTENITERKSERDFDMMLVEMGLSSHAKGSGYDKKNFGPFANCFDREIHRLISKASK